jgi:thiol-disulfide isomerase/thioredoxin
MKDYSGKSVTDFYTDRNYELILLNYWATFCAPCKKEMVDLAKLYNDYKDRGVLVLGAATDPPDKREQIKKIAASLGVTYPVLYGVEPVFNNEKIIGYPTTFLIKNGQVVEKIEGKRDYEFFADLIEAHLTSETAQSVSNQAEIEKSGYTVSYELTGRQDGAVLIVRLQPEEGYYLNGPGYPPLEVNLNAPGALTVEPEKKTMEGIAKGEDVVMGFMLQGPIDQAASVTCKLSLIVCDDNTCRKIDEEIEIPLQTGR